MAGTLLLFIFIGSNGLKHYDAALVPYTGACVLRVRDRLSLRHVAAASAYAQVLIQGWRIFFRPGRLPRNVFRLAQVFFTDFFQQRFIEKRSHMRWAAHWLIAWGCILAAAVTFPLSFGWGHFESAPNNQEVYRAFVFGQHVSTFHLGSVTAAITFNILDISAVMVLLGVALCAVPARGDRGAISVQQFAQDMMPLLMLFAISITGLFLTASTHLLHGLNYGFLSLLHAVTVIFTLLYLPFGKFFHIFQRPAQIGVQFYKEEGARAEQAKCLRCGQPFASRLHIEDLKEVQQALGIRYRLFRRRTLSATFAPRAGASRWPWRRTPSGESRARGPDLPRNRRAIMAKPRVTIPELVAQFGPHLNRIPAMGWNAEVEPDRIVKTHCCFCGQQCGIQLKVKDNRVIGFEPWEEFPFNQGRLCPKGVKRYMQDESLTG